MILMGAVIVYIVENSISGSIKLNNENALKTNERFY